MFLLLWRNKKHLHDESSPKHHLIKNALGGMYTQYEPSFWWFEIFLLINKTMMCGGLVMAAPGTPLQVLIAMLIMLSHLLIVLKTSPYDSDGEDVSSFLSSLTLTLTTIGGNVLIMDGAGDVSKKTFNSEALAYILIAISVLSIASQIGITIFIDCGVWERLCGKKQQKDQMVDKNKKTKVQPIQEIKSGSERHKKLRDIRLKYGADSEEYKMEVENVQNTDWNDRSDTLNVAKIMQDGQVDELYQRKALARQQTASHDHLEARLRAREKSHHPDNKTNENEPVAPVIPLEESTLWKQREEVKAAREAATAKRDF
jgi:hypothetical protein